MLPSLSVKSNDGGGIIQSLDDLMIAWYEGTDVSEDIILNAGVQREINRAVYRWSTEFPNLDRADFETRAGEVVWDVLQHEHIVDPNHEHPGAAFIKHIRKALNRLEAVAMEATQSSKSYRKGESGKKGKTLYTPKWTQDTLAKLYDPTQSILDDPESLYIESQEMDMVTAAIRQIIEQLDPPKRKAISMYLEQSGQGTQAEMAASMGVTLDAFENLIRLAKRAIRKAWEKHVKYSPRPP